jgi:type I restriction enzyme R subunit
MPTLYIDKPMKGHNLMQAIARVNRVYKDKIGGLVVDYLGIASDLKKPSPFTLMQVDVEILLRFRKKP